MNELVAVADCGFRDLDNRWVFIDDKKSIKRLIRRLKFKRGKDPLIAYFYVDKEDGLVLKLLGHVLKNHKDKLELDDAYVNEDYIINYEDILDLKIRILDTSITNYISGLKTIETAANIIPDDKLKLKETRVITDIDEFRNDAYPDDVEVLLEFEGNEEFLWVTIEGIMSNDIFICSIITPSIYSDAHKEGVLVGVEYLKEENILKIKGFLKERKK